MRPQHFARSNATDQNDTERGGIEPPPAIKPDGALAGRCLATRPSLQICGQMPRPDGARSAQQRGTFVHVPARPHGRLRCEGPDPRRGSGRACHFSRSSSPAPREGRTAHAARDASKRRNRPQGRPLLGHRPRPDAFTSHGPRPVAIFMAAAIWCVARAVWSVTGSMATSITEGQSTRADFPVKTSREKSSIYFRRSICAQFWADRPRGCRGDARPPAVRPARRARAAGPAPARRSRRARGCRSRARGRAPSAARTAR